MGAILVQSTAWRNVEQAIANLESADALSPCAIRDMDLQSLERLIRPSGFFRVKAKRLRSLCEFLGHRYEDDVGRMNEHPTADLRGDLLTVYGIGEETADDILLYALGRPIFVVDAFTRRVFHRLGWCAPDSSYNRSPEHVPQRSATRSSRVQRVPRPDRSPRQYDVQKETRLRSVPATLRLPQNRSLIRRPGCCWT